MPNDVKAVVSVVTLIVAAILAYWSGSPVRHDLATFLMVTAVFMVVSMWIFPEAGVKKGDLKSESRSWAGMNLQYDAAVLHRPGAALAIERISAAPLRRSDVLVRVRAAGLCHTDLEVIEGALRYPMPILLGHEAAGVVEEVGRRSPRSAGAIT